MAEMDDTSHRQAKRRRTAASSRRALSCTECKRRKTKCSAVGKVPCDSCVGRGKPADCRWEGLEPVDTVETVEPVVAAQGASEDALQRQVDRLQRLVDSLEGRLGEAVPPATREPRLKQSAMEDAATNLENLVVGPELRPGVTDSAAPSVHFPGPPEPTSRSLISLFGSQDLDRRLLTVLPILLPNSPSGRALVESFFNGPIHKTWHVIHRGRFESTFGRLRLMPLDEFESSVDPVWFSLYLMILAMALRFGSCQGLPHALTSHDLPGILHDGSERALRASNHLIHPQIGHIQVSVLYVLFLFHFGSSPDQANRALRHLDSAVTTLQWLGLDNVTEEAFDQRPLTDPALPDEPRAALELCKQLYHTLAFMDGTIFKRPSLWRLNPATAKCGLPCNVNEANIEDDRPVDELTEASVSRLGGIFVQVLRATPESSGEFDAALRSVIAQIPDATGQDSWMMQTLLASIHNRLIHLHRPFMLQGYEDASWSVARRVCVESAREIIRVQDNLSQHVHLRPEFLKRWVMKSLIVLAIDTLHEGDHSQCMTQVRGSFDSAMDGAIVAMLNGLDTLGTDATEPVPSEERVKAYFDDVQRRLDLQHEYNWQLDWFSWDMI